MIQVQKDKDKVLVSITSQLDREDVYQLVSDLNKWLEDTLEIPNFKGISEEKVREAWRYDNQNAGPSGLQFHNKEHEEAFLQAQSKRLLEEQMKHYIATLKPVQHVDKNLKVIELDPINREVELTTTKLKENAKRKK
jgi:hypothetical protein